MSTAIRFMAFAPADDIQKVVGDQCGVQDWRPLHLCHGPLLQVFLCRSGSLFCLRIISGHRDFASVEHVAPSV